MDSERLMKLNFSFKIKKNKINQLAHNANLIYMLVEFFEDLKIAKNEIIINKKSKFDHQIGAISLFITVKLCTANKTGVIKQ